MTDIHFACPQCGKSLKMPSEMAGNETDCPACKKRICIPAARRPATASKTFKIGSPVIMIGAIAAVLAVMLIASFIVLAFVIGTQRSSIRNAGDDSFLQKVFGESQKNKQKTATLRAWHDLQTIDNQLGQTQFATLSAKLRQQAYSYSTINLSDVDTILQKHLQKSVLVCQEAAKLCAEVESKAAAIQKNTETAVELGALFGTAAGKGYNPQGDAAAGALLFGIIGAAAQLQESENIQNHYRPQLERMEQRLRELNAEDKRIAAQLTKKYGVLFMDPL